MSEKILFVDDDSNLLDSYKRQLRKRFQMATALGGEEGLEIIAHKGPFAVVVSDMKMPEMDGIQFLAQVRERYPEAVRMMLTGNADLQTAVDAVNEGHIFRFLTKPCSPKELTAALESALEQFHLLKTEQKLLENTLRACIRVLTEILSLVNPTAFSRASRIKNYILHMAKELRLPNVWRFEVAALLSQIGCVTLPQVILNKIYGRRELNYTEQKMFNSHPRVGCKLLANIPRLELVARMIAGQLDSFQEQPDIKTLTPDEQIVVIGAQMLKIAIDFDQLVVRTISPGGALTILRKRKKDYNPRILDTLNSFKGSEIEVEVKECTVEELEIGMITDEHIKSNKGTMLVPMGHEVTYTVLERLRNFAKGVGVREPIRVRVALEESYV
ncbi:MAG: hypothetical protein AMJ79_13555 [Phycisphaerae bacterium SM23_30]|nr:MAG: hypothetical protein AMJ79_13555 [Phycisphaerae bacterium SM23_30]